MARRGAAIRHRRFLQSIYRAELADWRSWPQDAGRHCERSAAQSTAGRMQVTVRSLRCHHAALAAVAVAAPLERTRAERVARRRFSGAEGTAFRTMATSFTRLRWRRLTLVGHRGRRTGRRDGGVGAAHLGRSGRRRLHAHGAEVGQAVGLRRHLPLLPRLLRIGPLRRWRHRAGGPTIPAPTTTSRCGWPN